MYDLSLQGSVLGNYRLLRPLGQPGQGMSAQVYIAEHMSQHTVVALKVLNGYQDQTEVQRFVARASVLTHLSHPHIVAVLDYGVEGSTAFLVMQYLSHGTLRQRHPRGTILDPLLVLLYVEQIAVALWYVHQHNLIHRDIKPHNLLLGDAGEVLLSDFGIAVVSQSHAPESAAFHDFEGTVPYAAPEQLQGKPRRSSDQYALGVVVYEWLCGDWPFSGSFDEVVQKHLFEPPPPFSEKGITIRPAVEQVVMRALAKEPEQRFPDVVAFAQALKDAIQPRPAQPEQRGPQTFSAPMRLPAKGQFRSPLPFHKDTP